MSSRPAAPRWRAELLTACLAIVVVAAGSFTWQIFGQTSNAAFTKKTSNTGNTFGTASIDIADDTSGAAVMGGSGLIPGTTYRECVKVTYTSNVTSNVKVYASNYSGTLGQYVNLKIEEGSGTGTSTTPDCTDGTLFTSSATLWNATLADAAGTGQFMAKNSYANGVGTWAPTTTATKLYRFTWSIVQNGAAQGLTCSVVINWEARTT